MRHDAPFRRLTVSALAVVLSLAPLSSLTLGQFGLSGALAKNGEGNGGGNGGGQGGGNGNAGGRGSESAGRGGEASGPGSASAASGVAATSTDDRDATRRLGSTSARHAHERQERSGSHSGIGAAVGGMLDRIGEAVTGHRHRQSVEARRHRDDATATRSPTRTASRTRDRETVAATPAATTRPLRFASPSQLGRLNASHASMTALAHAAPNSAVGRIAAYRTAMLAAGASLATLSSARTGVTTAQDRLAAAQDVERRAQDALDAAQAAFQAAPSDATRAAVTSAEAALAAAQHLESLAQAQLADATAAVAQAEQDRQAALRDAAAALQSAANKPITESVVNQVNANLGLAADPSLTSDLMEAVEGPARVAGTTP
jgi:hypothetical protein